VHKASGYDRLHGPIGPLGNVALPPLPKHATLTRVQSHNFAGPERL
jgi:hypothetical protein